MSTVNIKKITLKEAYEELTDREAPVYGAQSIFCLANYFIGPHIIRSDKLHLKKSSVERFWQLFYALNRYNVVATYEDGKESQKHQKVVEFFLSLINFIELTYYKYNKSFLFFVFQTDYIKWLDYFQEYCHLNKEEKNENF